VGHIFYLVIYDPGKFPTMKRYIAVICSFFFLSIGCGPEKSSTSTVEPEPSKPNIIYMLADDLGYGDLSCYGQTHFETPNIDRLAAEGMRFTNHYSGATVCAPSRCALMTGKHGGHTYIRGNKEFKPEGQHPMPDTEFTIAKMLREQQYVTGAFGKWGLGFVGTTGDPNVQGFDQFYGYNCQRMAHNYYPDHLWENDQRIELSGNANRGIDQYAPELIHENALDFIRQNRDTNFFLFYPSVIPHAELLIPEKYLKEFRGKFTPEMAYEGVDDGDSYRIGPYGSQPESHAAFAAMVTLLDQQVGEVMDLVSELGLAENTLIIFTSDNGPHLEGGADPDYFDSNGPLTGYKRDLYEGGIRVPMIARWTDHIQEGSTNDHVSAFWDVMPTFAEITHANIPAEIDGISFLPTLQGKEEQPKHDYLYWEFHEKGGRQALRKDHWKIVRYDIKTDPDRPIQLFDLAADPSEQNDLAKVNPEKLKELTDLMLNARTTNPIFKFPGEE